MGRDDKREKSRLPRHAHLYDSPAVDDSSSSEESAYHDRRKKAKRSRKRRRSSTDESSQSASSTSGNSRSTASSPSHAPKARKRHRSERYHREPKKKHRSAKREKRRKHESDDEVEVLPPRQVTTKREKRRERESDDDVQVLPPRQMAPKRVVVQQRVVQPSEKIRVSGPPFPYPPSAGLRVPKEEFVKEYIVPRSVKRRELDKSHARASTPQAVQMVQPAPVIPARPVAQRRSTVGEAAVHSTSSLSTTTNPVASREVGAQATSTSNTQATVRGEGRKRSASNYEPIDNYLCRKFNKRLSTLWSVFRYQMDEVKKLLVGKHVQNDPLRYPGLGANFRVHDVTQQAPNTLKVGASTVEDQFKLRGIELKQSSLWPCLVHRKKKNDLLYYPLEVLKIEEVEEEPPVEPT